MEKFKNKSKKAIISIAIPLAGLIIIYLIISVYFLDHFYFGSSINSIDISCKTVKEVDKYMETKSHKYNLILQEQNGIKEEIKGTDIGLKYDAYNKIQNFKHDENPFLWIEGLFNKKIFKLNEVASFNKKLLKDYFNNLQCNNNSNIIQPKNPSFKYTSTGYKIIEGSIGNKVKKDILYSDITNAILKGKRTINLKLNSCYQSPKYNSNSKKVITIKNILNKYTLSKITYTFGNHTKILDGSIINTWLKVDNNLNIIFDEKKVKNYVDLLANNYDTLGRTRIFNTSLGKTIKVNGGDYGWKINKNEEVIDLIKAIKDGQIITKQPIYEQTALSQGNNDIGNTYVEIDIAKQYLWFYKKGSLIVKGNVVTGNVSRNHSTPTGTYKLNYKQRNAILKGPGYASPVSYWMPFNGGIGIHDANWREMFGGNIYLTNGSHGCVNAPYSVAKAIFYNIDKGTPIICHF